MTPSRKRIAEQYDLVLDEKELVGDHYDDFWNFKGRYRIVKGSRASKKSQTMTLWIILNMLKYPDANTLVIRKTEKSQRESTFAKFKQIIWDLGLWDLFSVNNTTMTITIKDTLQEIRFKGLDNEYKLTSMAATRGQICWVWIEEAEEIKNYEKIQRIDESIRDPIPEGSGLFHQITATFNPWTAFWAKTEFFDRCDNESASYDPMFAQDCLCKTTTHWQNEFLDPKMHDFYESYKERNPRLYKVIAQGEWGVPGNLIYGNWHIQPIPRIGKEELMHRLLNKYRNMKHVCGLDFGFEHNTALLEMYVDRKSNQVWIYNEVVFNHATNREIGDILTEKGYRKATIIADSADPKAIMELRRDFHFTNISRSRKGEDSVRHGIQFVRGFKNIFIFADCKETIQEILTYHYEQDDQTGELTEKPVEGNDHCMDAMRYGLSFIAQRSSIPSNR